MHCGVSDERKRKTMTDGMEALQEKGSYTTQEVVIVSFIGRLILFTNVNTLDILENNNNRKIYKCGLGPSYLEMVKMA